MALKSRNIKLPVAAFAVVFCYLLIEQPLAFGQQLSEKYDHPYLKSGDSLAAANEPFKALEAYQLALNMFILENDFRGQITVACKMGGINIGFSKFEEAEANLNGAMQAFHHISADSTFLADIYYRFGVLYDYKLQPETALSYHLDALNIRKRHLGEYSEPAAASYNAIASIYRFTLLDYYSAELYYLKALEIREKSAAPNRYKNLATLCYNLATTYRLKGDKEKAITYAHQAQTFYRLNNSQDHFYFSLCQNVLANIYFQRAEYRQSLGHFQKAVEFMEGSPYYSEIYLPTFFTNLGAVYIELNQPDTALMYLDRAMRILNETGDSVQMAHTYQQIGVAYLKIDSEEALPYYKKNEELIRLLFGDEHPQIALSYLDFALYFKTTGDHLKAVEYIKKSLAILDYRQLLNDNHEQIVHADVSAILEGLGILSSSQVKLYHKFKEIKYLEQAFENYLAINHILSNYRYRLARESSKLELAKDFKTTYEEALDCAYTLYKLKPTEEVASAAFMFMEKNKALVLLDFLRQAELNNILALPDSLRAKERSLETGLNFYTAELSQASGEEALEEVHSKIFSTERQLENFRKDLEKNYPEYYQINYAIDFYTLSQCRAYLKENDATLIEYFYGDSSVYVLAISPHADHAGFYRTDDPKSLKENVDSLLHHFYVDFDINHFERDFRGYVGSAFQLYQKLLQPILADNYLKPDGHNLIIVPDGILSFVPFEALISSQPAHTSPDYLALPYLVHRYAFSYSFSAQVLLEDKPREYPDHTLVFSYDKVDENGGPSLDPSLKGTSREAGFIAGLLPAKLYSGNSASKSNFREQVGDAGIIHLALHGKADRINPMKGALLFRGGEEDSFDDPLFYYELMELDIKARMAVLSACETGFGAHTEGEGVFHLARGFRYAGCPTLVASLWRIDDRSTAGIVEGFYRELVSNKKRLNQALRESKRKYLKDADELTAHPRHWAGLLLIGDTTPVILGNQHQSWHYLLLGIVLCLMLFIFLRRFLIFGIVTGKRTDPPDHNGVKFACR